MTYRVFILAALLSFLFGGLFTGCEREPGFGGSNTIIGKIRVRTYNEDFTILRDEYDAMDKNVYIQFGNNVSYGDREDTSYDGTFEFTGLNPGKYRVFTYGEDSTQSSPEDDIPVFVDVEIEGNNKLVDVGTITVVNNNASSGNAKIRGKVKVMNYNSSYTQLLEEYYAMDEGVYIIHGENWGYEDRVRTIFDGSYEFTDLGIGDYRVYIYSEDSTGTVPGGLVPVVQEVTITSNNQIVELPDLIRVD